MNANSAARPRMMPIKNLAKNGTVGVLKPRCTIAAARTRALTTPHRIKPTTEHRTCASPLGGLNPAEAPLIEAENLFKQPGPP